MTNFAPGNRVLALALAGALVSLGIDGTRAAQAQSDTLELAITHVAVIDVSAGKTIADQTVVIRGNRIAEIGTADSVKVAAGARVIDGKGRFLMPGLWDMHVHLGNATEAMLPIFVAYGVTGVRDMGSPSFELIRQWRVEALAGKRIAPRMVSPGPMLTMLTPFFWQMQVRNPEEARKAIDYLAGIGVDFIKITESFDRPTYFAIADETERLGIPLAGHLPTNEDGIGFKVSAIEASNAGQKCFEHGQGIPFQFEPQDIQVMLPTLLKNGTWIDPTLTTYWTQAHMAELVKAPEKDKDARLKYIPLSLKQMWDAQIAAGTGNPAIKKQVFQWRMEQIKTLNQAGVPLLAGTDLGHPYVFPGEVTKELALFVEAGLTPAEALKTATVNPARYLGREHELGTVETGKFADLLLLDADPLRAIKNVTQLRGIILNGRYFDRAQLDDMLNHSLN
jgi:imidazolonepropionase-like amidohydrolase